MKLTQALPAIAVLFLLAGSVVPVSAAKTTTYKTGLDLWRAADSGFSDWALSGVKLQDGMLALDPAYAKQETDTYLPGGYNGGNYYTGGSYLVGEATGPVVSAASGIREAVPSWNADTPAGTWVEVQMRAYFGDRPTKWYNLGIWAAGTETIQRHSVNAQGDADGYVSTDTLVISDKKALASAYQVKVRLFSVDGAAVPSLRLVSVAYSNDKAKQPSYPAGNRDYWNTLIDVPECSQMVYLDGGNVWCSPTSTSMVLAKWGWMPGLCEPRVRAAKDGVYDWVYKGHGNWPFNTAFAAAQGMEAYVARFTSLSELEPWIKAGVPVVMSVAWKKGELTDAATESTNGHLIVLVGFDADGNGLVNDPAAPTNDVVGRMYLRSELEKIWQENSSGTVYLIYPQGYAVPGK